MKKCMLLVVAAVSSLVWGEASGWAFSEVTAQQRWPWSRKVDIDFLATQTDAAASRLRAARVAVKLGETTLAAGQLTGTSILGAGRHRVVWTPPEDGSFPTEIKNAAFTVSLVDDVQDVGYMTVDLASGAVDYQPLSFSNTVNSATYKTTAMAFRYIPSTESGEWRSTMGKTTFKIGSDATRTDLGILAADRNREGQANVTLTKGFFMGVFPMTRKQYALLGGTIATQDQVPVRGVTYDMLRGVDGTNNLGLCCFPTTRSIDLNTPIGKMRLRTGLNFDFPTEAQWEHAARAGTEGEYFFSESGGNNVNTKLVEFGAYDRNTAVGTKKPNAWGLYDLIGCCHQWTTTCGRLTTESSDVGIKHVDATDPIGATTKMGSAPYRTCKGSHAGTGGGETQRRVGRVAYRFFQRTNCSGGEPDNTGCRLALTLNIK